jgi:hypothetical protein
MYIQMKCILMLQVADFMNYEEDAVKLARDTKWVFQWEVSVGDALGSTYRFRCGIFFSSTNNNISHKTQCSQHQTKLNITMNYLFVALSLLTMNPRGCFGFTTSSSKPSTTTTAVYFRPSDSHANDDDKSDAAPNAVFFTASSFSNGPHPALAAAIIRELCEEVLAGEAGEGDDLSDDDLFDQCFF